MFKKPNFDTLTESRQKVYTSKLLTYLSDNGEPDAAEYLNFLLQQKDETVSGKIDTSKLESIDGKILKVLEKIEENMIDEQDTRIRHKDYSKSGKGTGSSNGSENSNNSEDEDGSRGGSSFWLDRNRRRDKKRKKKLEKERKKREKLEKASKEQSKESKKTKSKTKTPKTPKFKGGGKLGKLANIGRLAINANTLSNVVPSFSSDTPKANSEPVKEPKVEVPKKTSENVQKKENDIKKAKSKTKENIKQEAKTVKASEGAKNTKLGKGAKTALKTVKNAGKALGAVGTIATVGLAAYEFSQAESTAKRKDIVAEAHSVCPSLGNKATPL